MRAFDQWNKLKKELHSSTLKKEFYVSRKEIRFVHLWINIGSEQNGKGDKFLRPVLVLKKTGSQYLIVPMTTQGKDTRCYHSLPDSYFWKTSRLILTQIRVLDKIRFNHKIGKLTPSDFQDVKKKLKAFLSL